MLSLLAGRSARRLPQLPRQVVEGRLVAFANRLPLGFGEFGDLRPVPVRPSVIGDAAEPADLHAELDDAQGVEQTLAAGDEVVLDFELFLRPDEAVRRL